MNTIVSALKRTMSTAAKTTLRPSAPFKLALVQLAVGADKATNLDRARAKILEAGSKGANVVVLPECFNSPYGTDYFPEYAEPLQGGPTTTMLSQAAEKAGVYLIGGSFPEKKGDKILNTLTAFDPEGKLIGIHRKVHLFDIDIPNKITFKESDILTAGDSLTHIDTSYGRIGLGICYDIRFPEMAMIAARKGCVAMIYPGAFNMTTGPLHWELLQRGRAVDNEMYVAACSPARDIDAKYHAWGHSTIVDPKGVVQATCGEKETIVYASIDPAEVQSTRETIPLYNQRRFDIYGDVADTVQLDNDGNGTRKPDTKTN